MLAKINEHVYVLHDNQTKITSQLSERRERRVTIVNNVKMNNKKTTIMKHKQVSSTGPSVCACLGNDGSTIDVPASHIIAFNGIVLLNFLRGSIRRGFQTTELSSLKLKLLSEDDGTQGKLE